MANDSTNTGHSSSVEDTQQSENYFHEMTAEDGFFGPEQLAQAGPGGEPVAVPVPQGQNVIRVQVNPGEILELSSPFDPGATLLGREADGNLAIRVGDVTVILVGFVEANGAAPVIVETSDGKPIDIATLLASTDPAIDIQTAAGPGDNGQGGQGADNTGAILAQLAAGNGLGGLDAVGKQDQTQLGYGLIDNSIRLDREDALLAPVSATAFRGINEPFLRDPFNDAHFTDFHSFFFGDSANGITGYQDYITSNPGKGWADFEGTQADDTDFDSYMQQTSFTNLVTHSSSFSEPLYIDIAALEVQLAGLTSDQSKLYIDPATVDYGHATTVFVRRESDDALVLVIHAHEAGHDLSDDTQYSSGDYQIDTFLINRLDHPGQGQDILDLNVPYNIPQLGSEEQELPPLTGTVQVQIRDDVPVTGETDYYSFLHACSFKDAADCFSSLLGGKITDVLKTHDFGHVDEDYIFGGNRDKDNANGPDSDEARGDDVGDRFVAGMLNINFGADGPSGKAPEGDCPTESNPLYQDATPPALQIAGLAVGDSFPGVTSQGHALVVLKHEMLGSPFSTVEMVQVGYAAEPSDPSSRSEEDSGDTVVFTLLLQTGPNLPLFGGFIFEQCAPLDHPVGATLESNLQLDFDIIATDDDGDHPTDPVTISILVNDDAPTFQITYFNEDPGNKIVDNLIATTALAGGGGNSGSFVTKDYGHVDEDWLRGGVSNDHLQLANGPGNRDQDGNYQDNANLYGDDRGGLEVCGQIKVKYGADGPSDSSGNGTLGLKFYQDAETTRPTFVNGDGSALTSDGKTLVVLESSATHLLVGVAPFIAGTGEGAHTVEEQPVFSLDLDPATGKFTFHLLGAIDHLPGTVDGQPESNLVLSFEVGFAQDFDLDQAIGTINIKVNDDKPEVGITYANEILQSVGDGYYSTSYSYDRDFGRIDEDWLNGGEGSNFWGSRDTDYFAVDNANKFGDDYGSSHLTGQINMKYGADGEGSQTIGLASLAGAFKDADGNALSSSGNALTVLSSSATQLLIGYGETVVFTLTLDSNGHFEFTQSGPLDHPIASPIEDNVYLAFKAGSVTDGDGDTADAIIKIQVNDDVPNGNVTYSAEPPESPQQQIITFGAPYVDYGQIDEDYLASGNKDQDNATPGDPSDAARGDEAGSTVIYGSISDSWFGADGPTGEPTQTFVLSKLGAGDPFRDAEGNVLTSQGHELVVLTSEDGVLQVGYHSDVPNGPDTLVFTLTMLDGNDFKFELNGPLDHAKHPGDLVEQSLVLVFGAEDEGSPTDFDGDPAARIVIHVNDDAPTVGAVDYASQEPDGDFIHSTDFGVVDEDFALQAPGNEDEDGDSGDTFGHGTMFFDLTAKFGADGPGGVAFVLQEGDQIPAKDDNGNTNPLKSTDGHTLLVHVAEASGTQVLSGYYNSDDSPGFSEGSSTVVFTLAYDQSKGGGQFDLQHALQHPVGGTEDNLFLSFGLAFADGDGDPAVATVNVKVNDDTPFFQSTRYVSFESVANGAQTGPTISYDHGRLDEDWLPNGNKGGDGAPSQGTNRVEGDLRAHLGADGGTLAFSVKETSAIAKTADGQWVRLHVDNSVAGKSTVIGYANSDDSDLEYHDGSSTQVFTVTLNVDPTDADFSKFSFDLLQALKHPDGTTENESVALSFDVVATDGDGDSHSMPISVEVADDAAKAVNDVYSNVFKGNVLANDLKGADGAIVTRISFGATEMAVTASGAVIVDDHNNKLEIHPDGSWTFLKNADDNTSGSPIFTYQVTDGDGDTSTATLQVNYAFTPIDGNHIFDPGNVLADNTSYDMNERQFIYETNASSGWQLAGGTQDDYIIANNGSNHFDFPAPGHDEGSYLEGREGNDILVGGAANDTVSGNEDNDLIFGGGGSDRLYGGSGDDKIYADADDLDGSNALGGISIDGGTGEDTLNLSALANFGGTEAQHVRNIETLDLTGGAGTHVTLNYNAAYGITEVGGLHVLTINGDATGDKVTLQDSGANTWSFVGNDGTYDSYTAGPAGSQVTVRVEQSVEHEVVA